MHSLSKFFFISLVSALIAGCAPSQKPETIEDSSPEIIKVTTPAPATSETEAYIQVGDQKPGRSIAVGTVSATGKNFIVIYRGTADDTHAEQIGQSQPVTDSQNNFNIILDKPIAIGDQLSAVLFADNGDNIFNQSEDTMLTDESGSAVQANFTVIAP